MSVDYGANQSFTITPDAGYHVADVLVDGSSVGAVTSYTFTNVTANHTIAASFAIDTYTITASRRRQRLDHADGRVTVDYGASQAFTITPTPATTWRTCWWTASPPGAVTSYTFVQQCDRLPHDRGVVRGGSVQRDGGIHVERDVGLHDCACGIHGPDSKSVSTWSWTFGDGGTSTVQNPSHAYAAAGTYTVTLTVTSGACRTRRRRPTTSR